MAKIKDVAKLAGVSPACVSLALNGKPYVSAKTKKRIYNAIEQLNYRPNIIARSLRNKKTHTIGLVLSDITNPFFPEIARGVETKAREYGFNVILCNTDADPLLEKNYIEVLLAKQVDGLILTSVRIMDDLDKYTKENCPLVFINRKPPLSDFDFVGIDNVASAKMAVEHLIKLGHRKIALIRGEPASWASFSRYEGYRMALKEAGIPYSDNLVKIGYLRYESGYRAMESLLKGSPIPTAIFCANDIMALGAIDACVDRKVKVPQDLAIVGFDDIWVASLKNVQLTTVHQPRYEMGAKAVELMVERIIGKRKKTKRVILPTKLVIRRTCGANFKISRGKWPNL
ncbi:LacI family DNA-binding transcriptional regulator [Candidatus Aerophobetes bacterium]|nr:LacI family DNA-binding transcriptional regulator [Candidatus Aerophobetes bacterium]